MMVKSLLCVGGPYAGQRYESTNEAGFRAAVLPPVKLAFDPDVEETFADIVVVEYRVLQFRTEQGEVEFWVPSGQTALDTITMLLETYERSMRK